jgi:hypothetical protein
MARKEKKAAKRVSAAPSVVPTAGLVYAGLACLFGVIAATGYLWQKSQIQTLGQQIRGYETRLEDAKRKRFALVRVYAEMCSPWGTNGLDARVKRNKLEIGPPQLDQIVRLWEPVLSTPEEKLVAAKKESQNLLTSIPTEKGIY